MLAWLYGHFLEYVVHKYILHNNKLFKKAFKRHFGTHHRISRKNDMYDVSYKTITKSASAFELMGLSILAVLHLPIYFFFPFFYLTLMCAATTYYIIHRKSHLNTAWGKKWFPWHAAHHMGKNQHLNWGVRLPIFDLLFGTYKKLYYD